MPEESAKQLREIVGNNDRCSLLSQTQFLCTVHYERDGFLPPLNASGF